jgi:hypothetical protein
MEFMELIKGMSWTSWVTVFGAIVLMIVTFIQSAANDQKDLDVESERKAAKEDRRLATIARRQAESFHKSSILEYEKILKKNEELSSEAKRINKQNQAVIRAQSETLKTIMGYGIPIIHPSLNAEGNLQLTLENNEDYPMHNFTIVVLSWSTDLKDKIINREILASVIRPYSLPNFELAILGSKGFHYLPYNLPFEVHTLLSLEIQISTLHGHFRQFLLITKAQQVGHITYCYKLYRLKNRKYKFINQNFTDDGTERLFERKFHLFPYEVIYD